MEGHQNEVKKYFKILLLIFILEIKIDFKLILFINKLFRGYFLF